MDVAMTAPQLRDRRPAVPVSLDYASVGAQYGRKVEAGLGLAATVTKKWQDEDLVWPYSDIDFRIVLDQPPADWIMASRTLACIHRELVRAAPARRRILEHPPGSIFLRREVEAGLVPPAEVCSWSCCFGSPGMIERWRSAASERTWGASDERFYEAILATRVDGAYHLEADSSDNVVLHTERYGAHCVAWHYVAPVAFAAESLCRRRRLRGKSEALEGQALREAAAFLRLARDGYRDAPATRVLMTQANSAVHALLQGWRPRPDAGDAPTRSEVVGAIGTLRCRIARYLYYLSPPPSVETGYLIAREGKDLHGAARVLRSALRGATSASRLVFERFLTLVPPAPTTTHSLRRFMLDALAHPRVVEDLFSADLVSLDLAG